MRQKIKYGTLVDQTNQFSKKMLIHLLEDVFNSIIYHL